MARKAKTERVRKPRRLKRERNTADAVSAPPQHDADYWNWLNSKHRAAQVLNSTPERPYWASIEYSGNPPVADYYPCTMFRKADRVYYGFLIRSHREEFVSARYRDDARREYTGGDGKSPL